MRKGMGLSFLLSLSMFLVLMVFLLPQAVVADGLPCRFYGEVKVNGNWVADGTLITAWIDDATSNWTGNTFTPLPPDPDTGKSVYVMDIPADSSSPGKDGGIVGDVVRFKVRYGGTDYQAAQTCVWQSGQFAEVNLAINTTAPVATLSGQPTGVVNYTTADITVGGAGVVAYKYKLVSSL